MQLTATESAMRLAAARFGVLGTADPDHGAHVVPVVFAVSGSDLTIPVDSVKAKSSARLRRVDNLERDPRATLLVDHRDDDWRNLWWVRADLTFTGHGDPTGKDRKALADKYASYGRRDSIVSILRFTIERHLGWSATNGGGI